MLNKKKGNMNTEKKVLRCDTKRAEVNEEDTEDRIQ